MAELSWFENGKKFAFIPLTELAQAVHSSEPRVQLPSFQRDAVWDEKRVEALWDSILRGFPIGSILFARPLGYQELAARHLQHSGAAPASRLQSGDNTVEFLLLDGQQRTTSIALGHMCWEEGQLARLWFDLQHTLNPKTDLRYGFHLCSAIHPWGKSATLAKKRHALEKLEPTVVLEDDSQLLGETWPAQALTPVPFAELLQLARKESLHNWHKLLPRPLQDEIPSDALSPRALESLSDTLQRVFDYQLPALLMKELPQAVDGERPSIVELGTAFQRLNRQGVPMSEEDLFFSGLKLHWPLAHNLVWEIYQDSNTGRFLSPTKIVHLSTRLTTSSRLPNPHDVAKLTLEQFRKLVEHQRGSEETVGEKSPFLQNLPFFLARSTDGSRSRLHLYLQQAKEAIVFRPREDGSPDIGLPLPLLARLRWRVWHTLVAWLQQHGEVDTQSRMEMIRYALLDHFFTKKPSSSGIVTLAFKLAQEEEGIFPGKKIFEKFQEPKHEYLETPLFTPEQYKESIFGEDKQPLGHILVHERDLIMWNQRKYLAQWFPRFDPTRYISAEDLPYDVDHILPWSCLDLRRSKGNPQNVSRFHLYKWHLANGPGNFRLWPKSENRSDQNRKVRDKLFLTEPADSPIPSERLQNWHIQTCGDVRRASLIEEGQIEQWRQISDGPKGSCDWSDPARLDAMLEAMICRRVSMYTALFDSTGFAEWLPEPT